MSKIAWNAQMRKIARGDAIVVFVGYLKTPERTEMDMKNDRNGLEIDRNGLEIDRNRLEIDQNELEIDRNGLEIGRNRL